jgi:hypothetical protein
MIALLSLGLAGGGIVKADIYNLSADWSNVANPNGTWSYWVNSAPAVSGTRANDTFANPPGAPPIWGDSSSTYVGWSKSNGSEAINGWDLQTGDVYGHTPSAGSIEIRWTSPVTGPIELSVGIWAIRDISRWNNCEFTYNGVVLGIPITIGDGDLWSRSNPFSGSGIVNVNAGDVFGFRVSPQGTPDYIAADITIDTLSPVPLPGAVVLGALGLSFAGWRLKRKPQ